MIVDGAASRDADGTEWAFCGAGEMSSFLIHVLVLQVILVYKKINCTVYLLNAYFSECMLYCNNVENATRHSKKLRIILQINIY